MTQRSKYPATALLFGAPLLLGAASMLAGCPIYDAESCGADPNCSPSALVDSGPLDTGGDTSPETGCGGAAGCGPGYVCENSGAGVFACKAYDCRAKEKACTGTQVCSEDKPGVWLCKTPGPDDCSKTGCVTGYACKDVAGSKRCESTDPNACVADGDCVAKSGFGAGSLCLGGVCKAPKDLCSDSTQCDAAASCLDGRCVPKCTTTCAKGYTCDTVTNACSGGAAACSLDKPCATGTSCVAGRCVAPAATNGACPVGLISVAGGCVLDDRPIFFCDKAGTADGTRDICAPGSICLHHNCYISCTGDPDCKTSDLPVCKSVTSSSGTPLKVCGSAKSGTQCDLTSTPAKPCATGKVCLDGTCV